MNMEFDEDVYQSRRVLGSEQEPRMAEIYKKIGISEKNVKKAILITPVIFFGLSIGLLLWYFL